MSWRTGSHCGGLWDPTGAALRTSIAWRRRVWRVDGPVVRLVSVEGARTTRLSLVVVPGEHLEAGVHGYSGPSLIQPGSRQAEA
jgi:hypothetical protein